MDDAPHIALQKHNTPARPGDFFTGKTPDKTAHPFHEVLLANMWIPAGKMGPQNEESCSLDTGWKTQCGGGNVRAKLKGRSGYPAGTWESSGGAAFLSLCCFLWWPLFYPLSLLRLCSPTLCQCSSFSRNLIYCHTLGEIPLGPWFDSFGSGLLHHILW